jgi:hypothetical protein
MEESVGAKGSNSRARIPSHTLPGFRVNGKFGQSPILFVLVLKKDLHKNWEQYGRTCVGPVLVEIFWNVIFGPLHRYLRVTPTAQDVLSPKFTHTTHTHTPEGEKASTQRCSDKKCSYYTFYFWCPDTLLRFAAHSNFTSNGEKATFIGKLHPVFCGCSWGRRQENM